jgi:hypothetical protein
MAPPRAKGATGVVLASAGSSMGGWGPGGGSPIGASSTRRGGFPWAKFTRWRTGVVASYTLICPSPS